MYKGIFAFLQSCMNALNAAILILSNAVSFE